MFHFRPFNRISLLVGMVIVPIATAMAHPEFAQRAGLDIWNLPGLEREMAEAEDLTRRLEADDADVRQRIAIKDALINELLANRMTLAEVTAEFMTLNLPRPECMAVIRTTYRGSTDQERMARNVIGYAMPRVHDSKERELLRIRLETELRIMLQQTPGSN